MTARPSAFAAVTGRAQDLVSRRETLCDQPPVEVMASGSPVTENFLPVIRAAAFEVIYRKPTGSTAAGAAWRHIRAVMRKDLRAIFGTTAAFAFSLSYAAGLLLTVTLVPLMHCLTVGFPVAMPVAALTGLAPKSMTIRLASMLTELREQLGNAAFCATFPGKLTHSRGSLSVRTRVNGTDIPPGPFCISTDFTW